MARILGSKLLLSFLAILFLSSCVTRTYRYKPTTINAKLFEQKGDFEIGMCASNLYGFNAAYAITNHLALGLGVSYFELSDSINVIDDMGVDRGDIEYLDNQVDYEIAFIYFNKFQSNDLAYEVQFGFGSNERIEEVNSDFDLSNTLYDFEKRKTPIYSRFFIQPAIGENGRYFDWNFAARLQFINYEDLEFRFPNSGLENYTDLVLEPTMTIRAGYKYIKFMFQIGTRFGYSNGPYDYEPVHLGVGLVVPINQHTVNWRN